MLEVEIAGRDLLGNDAPPDAEIIRLCALAASAGSVEDGHLAVDFVDERRIAALNGRHRGNHAPTDVLSFPIDGAEAAPGPRELGDVVICPAQTASIREAVVHGVLHLVGLDHERDEGEMLTLQREILGW